MATSSMGGHCPLAEEHGQHVIRERSLQCPLNGGDGAVEYREGIVCSGSEEGLAVQHLENFEHLLHI